MAGRIHKALNWGWNPEEHEAAEIRRVRTLASAGIISTLMAIPFILRAVYWGIPIRIFSLSVVLLLAAASLAWLRTHRDAAALRVSANLLCTSLIFAGMGGVVTGGGLGSPYQNWLFLLPLFAAITMGLRDAIRWAAVGVACLALTGILQHLGVHFDTQTPAYFLPYETMFQWTGVFIGLMLLIWVLLGELNHFEALSIERNRQMLEQMEERQRAEREAYRAELSMNRFLARMGHEVRTPLNAIVGFSQRLEKRLSPQLDERERGAFAHLSDNASYLMALVEDIFDLAALDSGTLTLTPGMVDVAQLMGSVHKLGELWAKPSNLTVTLRTCPNCMVYADARRLHQALANVVRHSVRRVSKGGVSLAAAVNEEELIIDIIDTAPPFTEEQRAKLFGRESDWKAPSDRDVLSGELGLVVAKALLDLQGGTLQCLPANDGNRYVVKMPLRAH